MLAQYHDSAVFESKLNGGRANEFTRWHQVEDAQAIADALAKDYTSKLEIPYVSAAIAQLHVFTSASASAAGASSDQLLAAVTANPNDHSARVALAGLLFAAGNKEAAIDHLLLCIKLDRCPALRLANFFFFIHAHCCRNWEGGKAKESLFKVGAVAECAIVTASHE